MSEFAEFGSREKDGWSDGNIVNAYVKHFVPITDKIGGEIVKRYISENDETLDLCCGQGTLTAALVNAGAKVAGLDYSPEMIARARDAAPAAEIHQGDAMAMPFADGSFDKVVCNFGMMHISDQPKALAEVRRVLKPGGRFAMATWVGPMASPAFAAVFGALKTHADFSAAPKQPDLFAFANSDQAREMMGNAGLEMSEHDEFPAEWVLNNPSELFEIFLTGTVGAGMLIRSQQAETIEKISEMISDTVANKFSDGARYKVPVPVAIISAIAI